MPYTPRGTLDILRSLRAGLIGRGDLTDLNRGSVLTLILSSVAEELASVERRLFTMRESFFLGGAVGSDLDERVAQLPPLGINRIVATNASSSSLRIARDPADTDATLLIPAGSTVQSNRGTTYRTTEAVVLGVGESSAEGVHIIATVAGSSGNTSIGSIDTIASMPSAVISVVNEQALTNGTDAETDEQLRNRALTYMKGLTRTSRATLEFVGASFVSSTGERFTYSKLYEDPTRLGYCELVVDDGSGLTVGSVSKPATTAINNITAGGQQVAFHDAPATAELLPENFIVWRGGDPTQQIAVGPYDFTSFPERGIVYFKDGVVQAGDRVFIHNYRVFTGFIKELQQEIEGDPADFDKLTGFRAAGTRVVVRPVDSQFISLDLQLTTTSNANYRVVEQQVLLAGERFVNGLAPGQTLYISKLVERLCAVPSVKDVRIYNSGTSDFADNITPTSARSVLRVRRGSFAIANANA